MTTALELLQAHPFLDGLGPDQMGRLAAWARRSQFRAGVRIFEEGGRADRFWLIRDGHVRLDTYLPGRGSVVIDSLAAGTVLGWSWLFDPHIWHFGATAAAPTLTIEFDAAAFRRLCDEDPVLGYALVQRFTRVVVDRLQATRIRLLDLYGAP
jgi:CRP/FNR family transcriptional regulator, cyclic AMP receptor protein